MTGNYIIRSVPKNSIIHYETITKKSIYSTCKIKSNTFSGVSTELEVRPRAFRFFMRSSSTVYAVLHNDTEKGPQCLFFFTFYTIRENRNLCICRCIGKTAVKRHWEEVINFIKFWDNY